MTVSGLVHLRCSYTNKYWVSYWESLLVLPKHVAFKGDNGQYLLLAGSKALSTLNSLAATLAIHPWGMSPNWTWGDSSDSTTDNADTLFWPVKVRKSVIVLRNYNNSYFYKRLTTEGKPSCLNSGVSTISKEARIGVEEVVISRSIYDMDFYLMSDSTTNNADTLFWLVKFGKSVIVLRNYNNSYFCKRLATEGKPSCLNAGVSTISKEARIGVEELVISRSIYDVDFYLMSESTTDNADTLFWPVKVGKSAIMLRNYNNSYFCKRLATEGKPSCLNAGVSTISKEARIGMEELVISRSIYDVDFYLMRSLRKHPD
ncbi:unnamed protein product [Linum tenue]|uniref:Agglutinin domain-containing protein n=1 Tax=Linum tenue TaxID=586396 RepID=A0AAV0LN45_9ROSI|nr:unnamed protein product [Linum tenue]